MQRIRLALAALLTCLTSLSSAAQICWWDHSKPDEGISLSAQLGLNLNKFTHVKRWNGTKAGVNVGLAIEKPILKSLSVKAGLLYSMKGTIGKNDGGFGGKITTTFSPSYLEIPILASYRLQYNDDVRLTFDFGPYFAIGLHGKDVIKYTGSSTFQDSETVNKVFSDRYLKRFDFGFQFGPSIVYKDHYVLGLIFDCGAINISNMGGKVGNFSFMINFGYKFHTFKYRKHQTSDHSVPMLQMLTKSNLK